MKKTLEILNKLDNKMLNFSSKDIKEALDEINKNQEHIKKSRAIVAMLFKHWKHYSRIRCRMFSDDTIQTSKTLYNKARRIYLACDNTKGRR